MKLLEALLTKMTFEREFFKIADAMANALSGLKITEETIKELEETLVSIDLVDELIGKNGIEAVGRYLRQLGYLAAENTLVEAARRVRKLHP